MSQQGYLSYYVKECMTGLEEAYRAVADRSALALWLVTRTVEPYYPFRRFRQGLGDRVRTERLPRRPQSGEHAADIVPDRCLFLYGSSRWGAELAREIEATIPAEIRGTCVFGDTIISVGGHDIWECSEVEEGQLLARTVLSVTFDAQTTPRNGRAFREALLSLSVVAAIRAELDEILGPVEQALYWFL